MPNFYDILGVSRTATDKDVRQAYRKLARQHHPDVNKGNKSSEEKFKSINEAYEVLSDAEKRRKYDRYGDNWAHADRIQEAEAQARSPRGGNVRWSTSNGEGAGTSPGFDPGAGDLFETLIKNMRETQRQPGVADHPVEITLEEAFQGATRMLELAGGRRLEVKIPAGVETGSRVRIPAGAGRQGDIYLSVTLAPDPRFQRQGRDLVCEVEVPLEDAVLGGEVAVPTIRSRVALTIPPETQNGQRFRLAGQGMPVLNQPGVRGDLYATIKARLPSGLSAQERELFQQLKALRPARRR
ncbi:MAG: J domain-containing protein [Dehalococcoidia bacterium]|nr:J domain-containing protein [Dehalococcoidia bacterium]MSQ16751.1 J domain-containing protein [Dehalococcoidia bacterium]